ncbi:basic salivary proline-rich protein 2-like [Hyaena hyaena]|uniref:basic salivary proline-rich protein 2-like n=1 Tax=Hyaena hyaena TaxID=95912 RepID=UPI001921A74C|nr:basic salivary proline-rich protein 2-like [Hyaena hyaena]
MQGDVRGTREPPWEEQVRNVNKTWFEACGPGLEQPFRIIKSPYYETYLDMTVLDYVLALTDLVQKKAENRCNSKVTRAPSPKPARGTTVTAAAPRRSCFRRRPQAPRLRGGHPRSPPPARAGPRVGSAAGARGTSEPRIIPFPFKSVRFQRKVETREALGGAGGGTTCKLSEPLNLHFWRESPSRRLGDPDTPLRPPPPLLSPRGWRPREETHRAEPGSLAHPLPQQRAAGALREPGLPARRAAQPGASPRGPRRRPGSVRAGAAPGPGRMHSRAGRRGSAARLPGIVRSRGAARPPPPYPARPRLTSAALPGPGRCGPGRAPSSRGRRRGRSGPPETGAERGPHGGRRVRAPAPRGHGRSAGRASPGPGTQGRGAPGWRRPRSLAPRRGGGLGWLRGARGRELGASCRGPERVSPPSVHAPIGRPAPPPPRPSAALPGPAPAPAPARTPARSRATSPSPVPSSTPTLVPPPHPSHSQASDPFRTPTRVGGIRRLRAAGKPQIRPPRTGDLESLVTVITAPGSQPVR